MTVAGAVGDRTFSVIERLCRTELDPEVFPTKVAERLRRAVPFDGYAVVTLDPLSGLATNFHFSEEMGSEEDARFFLENIYFEDDVLDYGWMARNRITAMTLSEATGAELERALRYREYNGPKGFGPGVCAPSLPCAGSPGAGCVWSGVRTSRTSASARSSFCAASRPTSAPACARRRSASRPAAKPPTATWGSRSTLPLRRRSGS